MIFALANLLLRKPLCPPKTTALIAVILGIVDFHVLQIMFFSSSLAQWTIPDNEDRLSSVVYVRLAIEVVLSLLPLLWRAFPLSPIKKTLIKRILKYRACRLTSLPEQTKAPARRYRQGHIEWTRFSKPQNQPGFRPPSIYGA
ncbi:hypothetical protein [Thalassospira sp. TSL5-1]|uniref:hypothetical protein n=1 Tax=Thalassospira sp. TSL5-1 TaxID=1544451 RepID=UPI001161031B|nr:hypothetical protein [Thalassospira sp. TSL5-1]